ncbi:MAG: hydroxymethylbilane synthase [Phycisphaerae bacterium]|nr:hydroxymethylbilane synthase [Phycisphaerae bacterium]
MTPPADSEKLLRIGTRSSKLATTQTQLVADAISQHYPEWQIQLIPMQTQGDRQKGPLNDVGGKGLFTGELEARLLAGDLDIAVHSGKDLPAAQPDGLLIAAALPREDPRDALVTREGITDIKKLPANATVGTGSLRRSALLRRIRDDLNIVPIRGNVDTRVKKVLGDDSGKPEFDAVILALAGLKRLGLFNTESHAKNIHPLEPDDILPAAAQGILAVQISADNSNLIEQLQTINHAPSLMAMQTEQAVLRGLNATCHSCLAVYAYPESDCWSAQAMTAEGDGANMRFAHASVKSPNPLPDLPAKILQQLL